MKILVTGATGLVGTNLTNRLIERGHIVFCVSRSAGFDLRNNASFIEDLKPDVVYHLAANAAESRGQVSPKDMTENNLNIFLNVLIPSINCKVKRFIYTSSIAVYGDALFPWTEESVPLPKDVYGVNKLACEQILKVLAKVHNFEYTIFRPHNIYGPHQDMTNPYKNVVALFMRNIIEGKEITLYDEGKMTRAFSYVDDVVDMLLHGVNNVWKNETINIGSSREVEIRDLLSMIERIAGKKAIVKNLPERKQEIKTFIANHYKQLGSYPYNETPLMEGLQKTWDFLTLPKLPLLKTQHNEII